MLSWVPITPAVRVNRLFEYVHGPEGDVTPRDPGVGDPGDPVVGVDPEGEVDDCEVADEDDSPEQLAWHAACLLIQPSEQAGLAAGLAPPAGVAGGVGVAAPLVTATAPGAPVVPPTPAVVAARGVTVVGPPATVAAGTVHEIWHEAAWELQPIMQIVVEHVDDWETQFIIEFGAVALAPLEPVPVEACASRIFPPAKAPGDIPSIAATAKRIAKARSTTLPARNRDRL